MKDRKQTTADLFKDFLSLKRAMLKELAGVKLNVPPAQKEVLFTLAHNDGMSIKNIAGSLSITPGAATQLTEALVQTGLVIREIDTKDRRVVHIYLSPQGRKTMQKLLKARLVLLEQLFEDLSDEEIEAFEAVIKKMNHKLENNKKDKGEEWQTYTPNHQTNRIKVS